MRIYPLKGVISRARRPRLRFPVAPYKSIERTRKLAAHVKR